MFEDMIQIMMILTMLVLILVMLLVMMMLVMMMVMLLGTTETCLLCSMAALQCSCCWES